MESNYAMSIEFDLSDSVDLYDAMETILLSRSVFELPQRVYDVCEALFNCSNEFLSRCDYHESYYI